MSLIPHFFINAVVSIGIINNTKTNWIGTGFFVIRKVNDVGDARPFLVTNKHVFSNKEKVIIRMRKKDSDEVITIDVPLFENGHGLVVAHSEPSIDIAVLPLNGQYIKENNLDFPAFDIDEHAMTSSELRENGADEGTLIHMLGFPLGLVNVHSTQPICRLGCIARINKVQIEEKHDMLVDIQNFPGNSGSPVISRPEVVSINGTKCLDRAVLIGIVHSYIPYKESLINAQTGEIVEIRSENSGIANVHPVEYIREIIDRIQPKTTGGPLAISKPETAAE